MRLLSWLFLAAATTLPLAAQGLSPVESESAAPQTGVQPPTNALDKDDLEFYVRHLFVYGPQINIVIADPQPSSIPGLKEIEVTASYQLAQKKHKFLVSEDGMHMVEGSIYTVDLNPFHETNEAIDLMAAPAFGKEGASVAIVVYSDFQCPYCQKEAQLMRGQLNALYGDKVRVFFRDFPLEMHDWARDASIAGRCVFVNEPEAFWSYHDWVFENQKALTKENLGAKVNEFVGTLELDQDKFNSCVAGRETEQDIERSLAEGREIGVTSTPTVFVNGRKMPGTPDWNTLKTVIDYELDYQEVTHNAGDDCGCTVELPGFPK